MNTKNDRIKEQEQEQEPHAAEGKKMDAKHNLYRMSYPAATGDVITQGHANYCAANGHAKWTVAGVDTGRCPRCDEKTTK